MTAVESPAVARLRVRRELRRAREAMHYTQAQVAKALDWSLSKVNRIESGEVSVSATDLRALLEHYGVDDESTVQQLQHDARTSRRQRWYTDPKYREHLNPATSQLLEFESAAAAIRVFNPIIIPGLLQTAEYAKSILDAVVGEDLSIEVVRARLDIRMQRYDQVLGRSDPPDYFVILDESVLHREVGGSKIMGDQLNHLLRVAEPANIRVRVVALADAAPIALLGQFTVLDLGDEGDTVLYREAFLMDEISQVPERVHRHREIFERLWSLSMDEPTSAAVIAARASAMLASHYRSAS